MKVNIYAVFGWIVVGLVMGACGMIDMSTDALVVDKGAENIQWARNPLPFWLGVAMVVTGVGYLLNDWRKG